jgi:S1-C subfamily serine protease
MLKIKVLSLILLGLIPIACAHGGKLTGDTVTMDRPLIQSLDEVSPDLKKLQNSLVRLTLVDGEKTSFGTGFFFRSKDMLVTSHHLFSESHECMTNQKCSLTIGVAKNAKELSEQTVAVEVILKHPDKDLIFLKISDTSKFAHIEPIAAQAKDSQGELTAAGFFQDKPELTFSKGATFKDSPLGDVKNSRSATTIIVSSGFSGSPVVNRKGELVGVVSSYRPINGQPIGLALFTSADEKNPF